MQHNEGCVCFQCAQQQCVMPQPNQSAAAAAAAAAVFQGEHQYDVHPPSSTKVIETQQQQQQQPQQQQQECAGPSKIGETSSGGIPKPTGKDTFAYLLFLFSFTDLALAFLVAKVSLINFLLR